MLILIDLDYTLFDTEKLRKNLESNSVDFDYKDLLYPDALEFLSYASKSGTPVLFSEGEVDFQKDKIKGTGLKKIFGRNIKIYPSYEKIFALPKIMQDGNTILIDDKPDIVDRATALGIKTIRVRRGRYDKVDTKLRPLSEVKNLTDIISKDLLRSL